MEISKLKPGMVLYDVHSETMGSTTMRSVGVWLVKILSVDGDSFTASWNGNAARKYYGVPSWWRIKKPTLVENSTGGSRLARRGEKGAIKELSYCFKLQPEGK